MKKLCVCLLTLCLAFMMTACGKGNQAQDAKSFQLDDLKTMGDAFALETTEEQSASSNAKYAYVFVIDGTIYRVSVDMPEDVAQAVSDTDITDENYQEKIEKLVAPLEITVRENLSERIPTQEELNKLVDHKGKHLLEDGWIVTGYDLDTMAFTMNHEEFSYTVIFGGKVKNSTDFDAEKAIKSLTVKSVTYAGLGDATGL